MRSLPHSKPRTSFAKLCTAAKRARWTSRSVICSSAATTVTGAVAQRTHYQVLGVHPTASSDDIRTAFRRLAKSLHPDHNKLPGAREKFQEVKQAYDVLVDTSSRTDYDQELKIQAMAAAAAAAQAAAGGRRASTLSFRRNRAAGSAKNQIAARPASGDDFDVFTAANTSPKLSSSPGSSSSSGGASYNSIFSDTRRSISRSRSAGRSRSGGYRSVFDSLPGAAPAAASPPSDGRQGIFDRVDAAATSTLGNSSSSSSGSSSSAGGSNSSIFNGRSISPNLGIRSQVAGGTTVPGRMAPASSNPAGPSPRAVDPTAFAGRTQSASSNSNKSYVNPASNSSSMGTVIGVYPPPPPFRATPAGTAPLAGGMPATSPPLAPPPPLPPSQPVTSEASYARGFGNSHQQAAALRSQTYPPPATPGGGSSAPPSSSTAVPTGEQPLSPQNGIQAIRYGATATASSSPVGAPPSSLPTAAPAPFGSSISDVASKLLTMAAVTTPGSRSGSGGSSSGAYVSIFGGVANLTAVTMGGRAPSPGQTSSSSSNGSVSTGSSTAGDMPVEATAAPSAFQVIVSPKVVSDVAARSTSEVLPQQTQQLSQMVTSTPVASRSSAIEDVLSPLSPHTAAVAAVAVVAAASTSTLVADAAAAARVAAAMAAAAEAKAAAAAAEAMAAEAAAVAARAKAAALAAEARLSAMVEATGAALPSSSSGEGTEVAELVPFSDVAVQPASAPTDPRVFEDVAGPPRGSVDCIVPQEVQDFVRKVGAFFAP